MAIVGEFTKATIPPAGLMAVMKGETLYLNAGGGGATLPFQSILNRLAIGKFSTTPILVKGCCKSPADSPGNSKYLC